MAGASKGAPVTSSGGADVGPAPEVKAVLAAFDADDTGAIVAGDVALAGAALRRAQRQLRQQQKVSIGLGAALACVVALFACSYAAVPGTERGARVGATSVSQLQTRSIIVGGRQFGDYSTVFLTSTVSNSAASPTSTVASPTIALGLAA